MRVHAYNRRWWARRVVEQAIARGEGVDIEAVAERYKVPVDFIWGVLERMDCIHRWGVESREELLRELSREARTVRGNAASAKNTGSRKRLPFSVPRSKEN